MVLTRSRRSPRIKQLKSEAEKQVVKEDVETPKPKRRRVVKPKAYKKETKVEVPVAKKPVKPATPKVVSSSVNDNELGKQKVQAYKVPAYKVLQLERLQRLIDMSSVAKPRGPITSKDFNAKMRERKENELRLSLDKQNKYKISNVTNYDPVRQKLVNGELTEQEIDEYSEKYEKIRKYKNIKVPKISDDLYLKEVLSEIVESNQSIKFWDYFSLRVNNDLASDSILLDNEKKLNSLIRFEVPENSAGVSIVPMPPVQEEVERIDIEKVETDFNLDNMLDKMVVEDDELASVSVADEALFSGLKESDYTSAI